MSPILYSLPSTTFLKSISMSLFSVSHVMPLNSGGFAVHVTEQQLFVSFTPNISPEQTSFEVQTSPLTSEHVKKTGFFN